MPDATRPRGSRRPYPPLVLGLFDRHVAARPGALAAVDEGGSLTWRGLAARVGEVAAALAEAGVGPEVPVGVELPRTLDLVVAVLATWRAGGVYVPLDPALPEARREALAARAGVAVRIGAGGVSGEAAPAGRVGEAAYVVFTSGSTGAPKGVVVEHRSLAALAAAMPAAFGIGPDSRVLLWASIGFDAAIGDLAGWLGAGATLHLARDTRPGPGLAELLRRRAITHLALTPSALALLPAEGLPDLQVLTVGGEPLPAALVARFAAGRRVINAYGPTEATVTAVCGDVHPDDPSPALGRPLGAARVVVVGGDGRPVGDGEVGEIVIGGPGVARGYLEGEGGFGRDGRGRVYRTGDLGRVRADGRIEHLGRLDGQVKVRGVRVEPGEVEAALLALPGVRAAAVVARPGPGGAARLVAYVVGEGGEAGLAGARGEGWRDALAARLPAAMVPAVIVPMAALPLLPSGKVDRAALPEPAGARPELPTPFVAPATPGEEVVAEAVAAVLGVRPVGREDNFFALGGDSLAAAALQARLGDDEAGVAAVYEAPTVRAIAARLEGRLPGQGGGSAVAVRGAAPVARGAGSGEVPVGGGEVPVGGGEVPAAQRRVWLERRLAPGSAAYRLELAVAVEGLREPERLVAAVRGLVARHEALRTTWPAVDGLPRLHVHAADVGWLDVRVGDPGGLDAPLDPEAGPPWRARVVAESGGCTLHLRAHHLVLDAASLAPLVRDLGALLEGEPDRTARSSAAFERATLVASGDGGGRGGAAGRPGADDNGASDAEKRRDETGACARIGEPDRTARSSAAFERATPARPDAGAAWWATELAGLGPRAGEAGRTLGTSGVGSGGGSAWRALAVEGEAAAAVRELGRTLGAPPFAVLLAALAGVLHARRGAGSDGAVPSGVRAGDMVVATPVRAGGGAVGFFAETLPLRLRLPGDPTGADLVAAARSAIAGALAHPLPFDRIVAAAGLAGTAASNPLFEVLLAVQDALPVVHTPGGLVLRATAAPPAEPPAPLSLELWPGGDDAGGGWVGHVGARADVPDGAALVAALVRDLPALLVAWAVDASRPLSVLLPAVPAPLPAVPALLPAVPAPLPAVSAAPPGTRPLAVLHGPPLPPPPAGPRTLPEALLHTAARHPTTPLTWVSADGARVGDYADLLTSAHSLAAGLAAAGLTAGDPLVLALDLPGDVHPAFWACQLLGVVPLVLSPPPTAEHASAARLAAAVTRLRAPVVARGPIPGISARILNLDELALPGGRVPVATPAPDAPAFLQATSGSTGGIKLVPETHRAVLRHVDSVVAGCGCAPADITLSWLPAEHVAALLMCHVKDTVVGAAQVHVATALVLAEPGRLLDLVERHRVTHTLVPNFGVALLAEAMAGPGRAWDLSSLRHIANGSEQVTLPVTRTFLERAARHGLDPAAMTPGFGMAELASVVTFDQAFTLADGVRHVRRRGDDLDVLPGAAADTTPYLSLGPPLPGVSLRVVDEGGAVVPEGRVGRLQVWSETVMPGYLDDPEATAAALLPDGWLDTGDLGFVWRGRLSLAGRARETISVRGAKVACVDVEAVAAAVPGVAVGAAFPVTEPGTGEERFVVAVVEAAGSGGAVLREVQAAVAARAGAAPLATVRVGSADLPRTPSGKLLRGELARRYLAGELGRDGGPERAADPGVAVLTRAWRPAPLLPGELPARVRVIDGAGSAGGGALREALARRPGVRVVEGGDVDAVVILGGTLEEATLVGLRGLVHGGRLRWVGTGGRSAAAAGALPGLAAEWPGLDARFVDVDDPATVVERALAELAAVGGPAEVAWRDGEPDRTARSSAAFERATLPASGDGGGRGGASQRPGADDNGASDAEKRRDETGARARIGERWAAGFEPVTAGAGDGGGAGDSTGAGDGAGAGKGRARGTGVATAALLRPGGSWLVTGGLGAVGRRVCARLLRGYGMRLHVVGRTADGSEALARLGEVAAAAGGSVRYSAVDVADRPALARALADAEPPDVVLHLAGTFEPRPLLAETDETLAAAWRAKVDGTAALLDALPGTPVLAFGSVAAFLPAPGAAAYGAANRAMEALLAGARPARHTQVVHWGAWDIPGVADPGAPRLDPERALDAWIAAVADGRDVVIAPYTPALARLVVLELPGSVEERRVGVAGPALAGPALAGPALAGPAPVASRPATPSSSHRAVAAVWRELLGRGDVDGGFFELGGDSLLLARLQARLSALAGREIPLVDLFRYPTVAAQAALLGGADRQVAEGRVAEQQLAEWQVPGGQFAEGQVAEGPGAPGGGPDVAARPSALGRPVAPSGSPVAPIAVIGMALRVPGASDVETFWANLCAGVVSIRRASPPPGASPRYVGARGVLDDVAGFDEAFFGMSPREAAETDPQHRLFLECAWEALEHAGYDPARVRGPVGVVGGAGPDGYRVHHLPAARLGHGTREGLAAMLGNDADHLATRVAWKLDLRGPALTVLTACSTGLVAVHQACRELRDGSCTIALAGGVHVGFPLGAGYESQPGHVLSPDGTCRPFDADAAGTVGGDGVAVVALKRLDRALADGDVIHAVIRGSAVNNDGARKVGYTAPSVDGQAAVVAAAVAAAGVPPWSIGYVEAHGTGTPLGDPIEVAALGRALGADREHPRWIGSVKGNVGHLNTAAGVVGLVKACLVVERGVIPPVPHFRQANPALELAAGALRVCDAPQAWPGAGDGGEPRRAGVSAFGFGGTNAHVVVAEPPPIARATLVASGERPVMLPVSARSPAALAMAVERLATHLAAHPDLPLGDVAFTLQAGRRPFPQRAAVVASTPAEAVAALRAWSGEARAAGERAAETRSAETRSAETRSAETRSAGASAARGGTPTVGFLFPGQGAQRAGMGRALYATEPVFREVVDRGLAAAGDETLERVLLGRDGDGAEAALGETRYAQPALFLVELALARLWMAYGVRPDVLVGHSVGELVAACVAGVLSTEDAVRFVAARGRLVQALPAGRMLAVDRGWAATEALLAELVGAVPAGETLALAVENAPDTCVVAGAPLAVEAFAATLQGRGIASRFLASRHAFHTPAMAPAEAALGELLHATRLRPPEIPILSTVTGEPLTDGEATDPAYWGRHLVAPVRFATTFARALRWPGGAESSEGPVFVEVGPGGALAGLARRHPGGAGRVIGGGVSPATGAGDRVGDERAAFAAGLGELWRRGGTVDPTEARGGLNRRVVLPTYPFERARRWVEAGPVAPVAVEGGSRGSVAAPPRTLSRVILASAAGHPLEALLAPLAAALRARGVGEVVMEPARSAQSSAAFERATMVASGDPAGGEAPLGSGDDGGMAPGWDERFEALRRAGRAPDTVVLLGADPAPVQLAVARRLFTDALALVAVGLEPRADASPAFPADLPAFAGELPAFPTDLPAFPAELAPGVPAVLPRLLRRVVAIGSATWAAAGDPTDLAERLADELTRSEPLVVLETRGRVVPEEPRPVIGGADQPSREPPGGPPPSRESAASGSAASGTGEASSVFAAARAVLAAAPVDAHPGLRPLLDALCAARILAYLRPAGLLPGAPVARATLVERLGVRPAFHRLLDAMIGFLVEDGLVTADADGTTLTLRGTTLTLRAEASTPPGAPPDLLADPAAAGDALAARLRAEHPRFDGIVDLLEHCRRAWPDALAGRIAAVGVLYPGGSPRLVEGAARRTLECRDDRAALLAACAALAGTAAGRPIRVLELGGGQGLLTWPALAALRDAGRSVTWHFTDLGAAFVADARREARALGFVDQMRFDVLDASGPAEPSRFPPGSYDVVVAYNAIHAVADLPAALRAARGHLAPGGQLLLVEVLRTERWDALTWGLAEGWWYYADDVRQGSPLLGIDAWRAVLAREGWEAVDAWPVEPELRAVVDHAVLFARAPGAPAGVAALPGGAGPPLLPPTAFASTVAQPPVVASARPANLPPFLPPRTPAEARVARVVEGLLGVAPVGVDDDFVSLGADSLMVLRLVDQLGRELGRELPPEAAYGGATVASLARTIEPSLPAGERHAAPWSSLAAQGPSLAAPRLAPTGPRPSPAAPQPSGAPLRSSPLSSPPSSPLIPIQPRGSRPPLYFVHPATGVVFPYFALARALGPDQPFYGLQALGLDGAAPIDTRVDDMARHYVRAIRAVQPRGPYHLGGFSFGALVAQEMAVQLAEAGEPPGLVALVDEPAPIDGYRPSPLVMSSMLARGATGALRPFFAEYLSLRDDRGGALRRFAARATLAGFFPDEGRALALAQPSLPHLFDLFLLHGRLTLTWEARAYPHRLTLLKATDLRGRAARDPTQGWRMLAGGGVDVFRLPGDHLTLLRPPHVATLADRLARCLAAANGDPP